MSNLVERISIFVASPGDVAPERDLLAQVVEKKLNRNLAKGLDVTLELVRWETHVRPGVGRPQAVINEQIGRMKDKALFIGIMWSRFGSPTGVAASGTEEEFHSAFEDFQKYGTPEVMFYFAERAVILRTPDEAEQHRKVLEFRKGLEQKALIGIYSDPKDFEAKVREHLTQWLLSRRRVEPTMAPTEGLRSATPGVPASPPKRTVSDSGRWTLIGQAAILAERVSQPSNKPWVVEYCARTAEEDGILKSLQNVKATIPFVHGSDAALVSIVGADRSADEMGIFWTFTLRIVDRLDDGLRSEIATPGYSGDDIAALRARWILLNEYPDKGQINNNLILPTLLHGVSAPVKVQGCALVSASKNINPSAEGFLEAVRLVAVLVLRGSCTIGTVIKLELTRLSEQEIGVSFRGARPRIYSNTEPKVIDVEGICRLDG